VRVNACPLKPVADFELGSQDVFLGELGVTGYKAVVIQMQQWLGPG